MTVYIITTIQGLNSSLFANTEGIYNAWKLQECLTKCFEVRVVNLFFYKTSDHSKMRADNLCHIVKIKPLELMVMNIIAVEVETLFCIEHGSGTRGVGSRE